jgi:NADPH:quinone reductase-like Zn-dependent oxidoreductase
MSMKAIVTVGQGGFEQLQWRDVPVPVPGPGEVLLQVLAAGVNNTDVNTRIGWYGVPGDAPAASDAGGAAPGPLAGWSGATPFPLIQGADCCARVVAVAAGGDPALVGRRVLVRPCMRRDGFGSMDTVWLGSDMDGAFAQYVKVPAGEVFPIDCAWSDVELATIPCAYGTAENMLHRAGVAAGHRVLVSGASGGVGSAVVQLARRRGAEVIAITTAPKAEQLRALGAQRVLLRDEDPCKVLGAGAVDVVVDNVAGAGFGPLLRSLRRGGRYVSSGAIAGPLVALDMRTLYLNDLTLIGCTAWDAPVFGQLVQAIERNEIRPLVAGVFALQNIAQAQHAFLDRAHVGNFVLVPPQQLPE